MARRAVPEINAGSMADIAFLLLIFFLVTTTMDSDEGILRQLPPPVPEDQIVPDVIQRNVYVVLVNAQDQLLVEGEYMRIENLKEGAIRFLKANGVFTDFPEDPDLPVRSWVKRAEIEKSLEEAKSALAGSTDERNIKYYSDQVDKWTRKLTAIELLGEFKELPPSALISMQNDNGTSYDMYIQVQNELESAVNQLRDELSLEKFGVSFAELEQLSNSAEDKDKYRDRMFAIREVYPQRISEAEPKNVGTY